MKAIIFIISGWIIPEVLLTFWKAATWGDVYVKMGYVACVLFIWVYAIMNYKNHKEKYANSKSV